MSETQELGHVLVRAFEMLRMHQESMFKATLATTAAVEALKETNPEFAAAYDKHYWELKQGRLGEENNVASRIIDEIKRELRTVAAAQGAGD
ncbi:MAG: hypothetical protein ACR2IF_01545 [Terriglobales bacterium]